MTAPTFAAGREEPSVPEAVLALLDEDAATQRLLAAGLTIAKARPEYLRHKAGETSIVSYLFDTPDGGVGRGYVQWCARADRADEIHRKAATLRPRTSDVGVPIARVDAHTVFYGFPNDARLRRLRWYSSPRKLKRSLASLAPGGERISKSRSSSTVLKYKPERRLVSKVELVTASGNSQQLLLRYATARNAHRLAATALALTSGGVQTPTPLAQLDDGRVGIDSFIDGVELRTWLLTNDSAADELAESLLAFHATSPPTATPTRTESDDLANAVSGLEALRRLNVGVGDLVEPVATSLAAAEPRGRTTALIHGDLHDKNVMVNEQGVWFIDLERVAIGSPASDLGRLRAHALSLEVRQPGFSSRALPHAEHVIDRYRHASRGAAQRAIGDAELAWHCAIALVDQALLVARHLEPGHETTARALLEMAIDQLAGSLPASTVMSR